MQQNLDVQKHKWNEQREKYREVLWYMCIKKMRHLLCSKNDINCKRTRPFSMKFWILQYLKYKENTLDYSVSFVFLFQQLPPQKYDKSISQFQPLKYYALFQCFNIDREFYAKNVLFVPIFQQLLAVKGQDVPFYLSLHVVIIYSTVLELIHFLQLFNMVDRYLL